jgi:SAM-dependent methyltransferase
MKSGNFQSQHKDSIKTWSTPVTGQQSEYILCALCGGGRFKPYLSCEGFVYVKCPSCGLVQINPQPETEEVHRRYGDSYGADYLSYELANETAFLRLQELALRDARFFDLEGGSLPPAPYPPTACIPLPPLRGSSPPQRPPLSVLDVGCATGALLAKLKARGWDVCGVEISGPQAEYARRERQLDVRTGPLEAHLFPDEHFTAILASHLIEHLNRPEIFVREVHRILKKDGGFFVTTPNIAGLQFRLFREKWRSAIFDHLYLFSVKTLPALLAQNGFRVERLVTWGGLAAGIAPQPLKHLADRAAKRLGFGDVMIVRAVKV